MKTLRPLAFICVFAAASRAQVAPAPVTAPDSASPAATSASPAPAAPSSAAPDSSLSSDANQRDKAVVLDPFTVDATGDRGYDSQNTLSGTRLNTPARYTGAADTEITMPLMMDLGLFSSADILDFAPNTSAYQGGGYNSTSDTGPLFGFIYAVRGLTINTMSQDFLN